ncbi:MAG: hypothetical protein O7E57_00365 [Gammaproteobacteria bacterium]|nr:hypothetical protein [Gammaproteobacteria bacterium]
MALSFSRLTCLNSNPYTFAVGTLEDASDILNVDDIPILMFGGPLPAGIPTLLRRGLTPTIHNLALGERVPIAGVSLEYTNLDISQIHAEVGDEVVLLGRSGDESIGLDDLAVWWKVGPLHALMSFSRTIPRVPVSPTPFI